MIPSHASILNKYFLEDCPAKKHLKKMLFRSYLLVYLTTELIFGSDFSVRILSQLRKIELETELNNGLFIYHRMEHIPYLYEMVHAKIDFRSVNKKRTIVDVGAHIGTFSLINGRGNTVYAFEPNKENYSFLQDNIRLNELERSIFPYRLGVSNSSGYKRLYLTNGSGSHSLYLKSRRFEKIKTTTLDEFFKDVQIDFIKIDVEGEEANILEGAKQTIEKFHPDMLVELHPWYTQSNSVIKILMDYGYEIEYLDKLNITARFKK